MRDQPDARFGDVLTIDELAVYLKISRSTLYKLAREGKLPGKKVGRHWRFQRQAVDRWLTGGMEKREREEPRE